MDGLIIFICFLLTAEALYVSSPFFKSSYKTIGECPLQVTHEECRSYASLFNFEMTNVSVDSSSGCLYNGNYVWNNKKSDGPCFPFQCVCKRNKASTKRYTFGKKRPYETLPNEHVTEEVVSQADLITDLVYENNTKLYSVDFTVPASTSSDIFYKKGLKFETDNFTFTYSKMNSNGLEYRPIDNILYRSLQEAKDSCNKNAGKCRGINEKIKNNVTFFTRHKIDGSSSVKANYYQDEMLFVRYRKLLQSRSYFLMEATDIINAKSICDQTHTCFAYGQEYTVGDAFLPSSFGFGNTVCETEAICQSHCSTDPTCDGYSAYTYVDANTEWLNKARSETSVYYSGYSCENPLDCKKKCATDPTCKGYTKFWKARAYKDYTSDLQTMNSYECNLLKTNDDLWDGGHPKESAAILTNGEDWLQKNNTQCPSWYQDQWMYMIAYPNSYYLKYTYTACKLTGQNSLNPGRVDVGMRGCRIVGQIGNRKCMPEDERNKVLWEVHYDDMSRHYIGGGYNNRGVEPLGYGQSWSCTNGDGWYNNQPFLGNPPTTDTCLCYPDTVNELPVGTSFSLNYRFEETVYKKVYYEYGVEVRTSSIPINVERVYTKTRNARQFRYGPKQNGLVLGQTMPNTIRVVGDVIYETEQILENSFSITRDSSQTFKFYAALFFKKYVVPDRFIYLGYTSESLNEALTDCSQSSTCEGLNVVNRKARDPTRSVIHEKITYNLQFSSSEVFKLGTVNEYFVGLAATFTFDTSNRVQTWKMIQTDSTVHLAGENMQLTTDCVQFCAGYKFQIQVRDICFCRDTFLPSGSVVFTTGDCLEGFKKSPSGECIKCFTGEYINDDGVCTSCPNGYLGVGAPGLHSCLTCPAGRYLNATNETHTCEACPIGRYAPTASSTSIYDCIECEIGKYTNQIASEDCQNCPLGNKYSTTECEECPIGTFNDAHDYVCDVCALGRYNSETGQPSCKECPLGKKYTLTSCDDCPTGSFNNAHDDICDLCDNFHYQDQISQTSCKLCPDGKRVKINNWYYAYKGTFWSKESCTGKCNPPMDSNYNLILDQGHQYGNHFNLRNKVPPSYEGASDISQCRMIPCPGGTEMVYEGYHDLYTNTFPPDYYVYNCGENCVRTSIPDEWVTPPPTCTDCPVGQYGTDNEPHFNNASCTDCLLPFYQDETAQTSCKRCEEGYFLTVGNPNTCTLCNEGFYNDEKDKYDCKQCEGGYVDALRQSCEACVPGKFTPVPSETCQDCHTTLGDQKVNEILLSKKTLSFQGSSCNTFDVCLQYCREDLNCMGFSAWTTGVSANMIYTYGPLTDPIVYTMTDAQNNQRSLFSSYYLPTSKLFDNVTMSFNDFFSGGVNCTNCPLDQSTRESEVTVDNPQVLYGFCKECNFTLEYYDALTELCTECVPGRVTSVHNSILSAIDSPTPAYLQNLDAEVCLDCPLGTVGTDPLHFCSGCFGAEGKYMDEVAKTECKTCILGSILDVVSHNVTAKSCTPCARGYQDELLKDACKLCPVGRFVTLTPGAETLDEGCTQCAAGLFNDEIDKNSCKACPPGSVTNTLTAVGASTCTQCLPGTVSQSSTVSCGSCQPGYYQNEHGKTTCKECPLGRFYTTGENFIAMETSCSGLCPSGRFGSVTAQTSENAACQDCFAGTYEDRQGSSECKNCIPGRYLPTEAGTSLSDCLLCNAGYFNALEAQTSIQSCHACAPGKYENEQGSAACNNCAVGKYSDGTTAATAESVCVSCVAGLYNDLEAQVYVYSCKGCLAGTFTDQAASSSCKNCLVGRSQPLQNQTDCNDCPIDTYQNQQGQPQCKTCPNGKYNEETAQSACKICDAGQYNNLAIAVPQQTIYEVTIVEKETHWDSATNSWADTEHKLNFVETKFSNAIGMFTSSSTCESIAAVVGKTFHTDTNNEFPRGCSYNTSDPSKLYYGTSNSAQCSEDYPCLTHPTVDSGFVQMSEEECEKIANFEGFFFVGSSFPPGMDQSIIPQGCVRPRSGGYNSYTFYNKASSTADCSAGVSPFWECLAYEPPNPNLCDDCPYATSALKSTATGADDAGYSSCPYCVAGQYGDEQGLSTCKECAAGKFGAISYVARSLGYLSYLVNDLSVNANQCEQYANSQASLTWGGTFYGGGNNRHINPRGCYYKTYNYVVYYNTYHGGGTGTCYRSSRSIYGSTYCVMKTNPSTAVPQLESNTCVDCSPGTYSDETGKDSCTSCVAGKFEPSSGSTECSLCAAGKYEPLSRQTECNELCPAGKYGKVTNDLRISLESACSDCPAGKTSTSGSDILNDCQNCPVGKYAQSGAPSCIDCEAGKFAGTAGSGACELCPQGKYEPSIGQSACDLCPSGKYGKVTNDLRTSIALGCSNCPAGKQSGTGTVNLNDCTNCPAGKHNPTAGGSCSNCIKGKSSGAGATACSSCAVGKFTSSDGQSPCSPCAQNTFASVTGSTSCTPCDKDKFTYSTGSSSCLKRFVFFHEGTTDRSESSLNTCQYKTLAEYPGGFENGYQDYVEMHMNGKWINPYLNPTIGHIYASRNDDCGTSNDDYYWIAENKGEFFEKPKQLCDGEWNVAPQKQTCMYNWWTGNYDICYDSGYWDNAYILCIPSGH